MEENEFTNLQDKVVVITGGTGVICSVIARHLGNSGAKLAILYHTRKRMDELSKILDKDGIEYLAIQGDVLDKASLERAAEKIIAAYQRIDILINGAGGNKAEATTNPDKSFFDLPEEAVRWVFDLNLLGTFLSCQVFGQYLTDQGQGIILNISSMNAFTPLTRVPAYSAAKAAVSNFTRWLAVHISRNYSPDIRVNAIAPGFLLTNQNHYLLIDEEGEMTGRGRAIIDHIPMGRYGDPEDIVSTVFWLLSSGSKYIHGTVIPIDGGFSAFSGV